MRMLPAPSLHSSAMVGENMVEKSFIVSVCIVEMQHTSNALI